VVRANGKNGFVARLSASGEARWAQAVASAGTIQLAALPDGKVVVNGDTVGGMPERVGIAARDAQGRLSWFVAAETSPPSNPRLPLEPSLIAAAGSDVFWVGRFERSIRIQDGALSHGADYEDGVFVARVNGGRVLSLGRVPEARAGAGERAWPIVIATTPRWCWVAGELRGTSRGAFAHRIAR